MKIKKKIKKQPEAHSEPTQKPEMEIQPLHAVNYFLK